MKKPNTSIFPSNLDTESRWNTRYAFRHGSGSSVWILCVSMYVRAASMCHNSGASLTGTTYNHFRAKSCTTEERVMPAVWGRGSRRAHKSDGYNILAHKYWHQDTYFSLSFTSTHKNEPRNAACWVWGPCDQSGWPRPSPLSLSLPHLSVSSRWSASFQQEMWRDGSSLLLNASCFYKTSLLKRTKHFLFIVHTYIRQLYFHNIALTYIHLKKCQRTSSERALEFFCFKKLHVFMLLYNLQYT